MKIISITNGEVKVFNDIVQYKPKPKFSDKFAVDDGLDGHGSFLMMTDSISDRFDNSPSTAYQFTGMAAWSEEQRLLSKMYELKATLGRALTPAEVEAIEIGDQHE